MLNTRLATNFYIVYELVYCVIPTSHPNNSTNMFEPTAASPVLLWS